jgi:hypothetical protein
VEVRFAPEADGTRVDLEHRGPDGAAASSPGFDTGWTEVLSYFVAAA